MSLATVVVILYLALINFIASVFQGICGFGDIVALQVLWHVGSSIAPDTFHSTPLGANDVRTVTYLSYVRSFFMQIAFTALLFYEEWRVNVHRDRDNLPRKKTHFNVQFSLSLMAPMLVGAYVGVETIEDFNEATLRVILGATSFFFALTLLSLHMMRQLETRRIGSVIKEDLALMRASQEVRRHEEMREIEALERRRVSRQRHRRHQQERSLHVHTRDADATKVVVDEQKDKMERLRGESSGGDAACVATATVHDASVRLGGDGRKQKNVPAAASLPERPVAHRSSSSRSAESGGEEEDENSSNSASDPSQPRSLAAASSGCGSGVLTTAGSSTTPRAGYGLGSRRLTSATSPNHLQGGGTSLAALSDLGEYLCERLNEISHENSDQSATAALTLQGIQNMNGISTFPPQQQSPMGGSTTVSSRQRQREGEGRGGSLHKARSSTGSQSSSSMRRERCGGRRVEGGSSDGSGDGDDVVDSSSSHSSSVPVATEKDGSGAMSNLHQGFSMIDEISLGTPMTVQELSKSMAGAAKASASVGEVNVGLREVQQLQIEALQRDSAKSKKRGKKIRFVRMDGAVVSGAVVSSFFGGLLTSYTGVGVPAQMIFVLAMNISGSLFKINYAASGILPATLRLALGVVDGQLESAFFPYYLSSMLGGAAGLVVGVVVGQRTAITGFFMSVVVSLVLVSLAMVTDNPYVLVVSVVLAVIALVYITRTEQRSLEHHVPPPPPNTPTTASERKLFGAYWSACDERMRKAAGYVTNDSFDSDFSFPDRTRQRPHGKAAPFPAQQEDRHGRDAPAYLHRDNDADLQQFFSGKKQSGKATDITVTVDDDVVATMSAPPVANHTMVFSETAKRSLTAQQHQWASMKDLQNEEARRSNSDEEALDDVNMVVIVPVVEANRTAWL